MGEIKTRAFLAGLTKEYIAPVYRLPTPSSQASTSVVSGVPRTQEEWFDKFRGLIKNQTKLERFVMLEKWIKRSTTISDEQRETLLLSLFYKRQSIEDEIPNGGKVYWDQFKNDDDMPSVNWDESSASIDSTFKTAVNWGYKYSKMIRDCNGLDSLITLHNIIGDNDEIDQLTKKSLQSYIMGKMKHLNK